MSSEDFPALPGTQNNDNSTSTGSGSEAKMSSTSTTSSTVSNSNLNLNKRGLQISTDGKVFRSKVHQHYLHLACKLFIFFYLKFFKDYS